MRALLKRFTLAIDVLDSLRQRHDAVPACLHCLIAEQQRLRNSIPAGVLGQAVAAVFQSRDLPYSDLSLGYAVLNQ